MPADPRWLAAALALALGGSACRRSPAPATEAASDQAAAPAAPARPAAEPAPVAVVDAVRGDVRVQRGGNGPWSALGPGARIGALDAVQALGGGHATLRLTRTGATLELEAGTTIRLAAATPEVHAVTGHMVARLDAADHATQRVEVALPPGRLVLEAVAGGAGAEAAIDVEREVLSIETRSGRSELQRPGRQAVAIEARRWARFDAAGELVDAGSVDDVLVPTAPAEGARVRTQRDVGFAWPAVAGATGYELVLASRGAERTVRVVTPSATVALAAGEVRWSVRAVGRRTGQAAGAAPTELVRSSTRGLWIELDRQPPPLTLVSPAQGAVVVGPRVALRGLSEPGATVEAGAAHVVVGPDGTFTLEIELTRGLSNLVVSARDDLGNRRRQPWSLLWE